MSAGPRPAYAWLFLAAGVACLLLLNLEFAPDWMAEDGEGGLDAGPSAVAEPTPRASEDLTPRIPAAARVPTIVARFGTESKEPLDDSGIKALATAMIEDHDSRVLLEGHSDTIGAEDFNHDLSLERANLVKNRLVALGVSEERVEVVGLGGTRPLHSDQPDAASVNRRVEVRWVGKSEFETRRKNPDVPRIPPGTVMPNVIAIDSGAALVPALRVDAGASPNVTNRVVDAGNTVGQIVADAGSSAPVVEPVRDLDAGDSL